MNKNDAINGALRWIDEATVNGAAASNGFIADYKDRMEHLLDGAVAMVESQFPLIESISIVQNMPRCMEGSHLKLRRFIPVIPTSLPTVMQKPTRLKFAVF